VTLPRKLNTIDMDKILSKHSDGIDIDMSVGNMGKRLEVTLPCKLNTIDMDKILSKHSYGIDIDMSVRNMGKSQSIGISIAACHFFTSCLTHFISFSLHFA